MTAEPGWDLLNKTELRIERIGLAAADLTEIAAVVAGVLGLPAEDVIVIDARDDVLALDVLRSTVDAYRIAGRRTELLAALAGVQGVTVDDTTSLCSEGMLGWIAADDSAAGDALDRAQVMARQIERTIAMRAIVFSTGPEVVSGMIRDTNKPWIAGRFRDAGFAVTEGQNLPDDGAAIAAALREAGQELGYGVVITTGGVGAEGKDGTVEALLSVDPRAATPTLFTVEQGRGRHTKAQVRIGVGAVGTAIVVCLPGPHSEAIVGADALLSAIALTRETHAVADAVATVLRARLRRTHRTEPT
ncbi:molybdopterin-binding protein [Mycolicibacterium moriokaense]|uniref:Molybdenum cofactor synthesis domain-containing protein n=1 Tax=Mycolicibacterium moriokaense TaxID=39691 RepID=A0A318HA39_9MYCO|nr:molybdopterin-binding protein [Mycolicibacterium moriokaense]PXX03284.1 molybdenum cofactor synthesis domain-containing protein [Mycolicibacterium moriokaense]